MIRFFLTLLLLTFLSSARSQNDSKIDAAYGLITRITPNYKTQFKLELIPADSSGKDTYEIDGGKGHIILRGNNTIAIATAFNQYLKYTCNTHLSWLGDQLDLPKILPAPAKKIRNVINGKYRVFFNYCTFSYSSAWWNWERWQRELDFLAMNSINMPLAMVGVEAVWYNTLLRFNFTDEEARDFLVAPSHFAWQWMQNIQSYGGRLPKSWINEHISLGKKIIQRQLELGMQPIQQGFSGYVPRELIEKYKGAKIRLQPSWCNFKGVAQLDPTDPLFTTFGKIFLEEEKKLFGAHGVYAADPFHESSPPIQTKEYLSKVGHTIYQLFKQFDPQSKWAMQSWSIREDITKAIPQKDLIILDLNGERSTEKNCFWGYPTISGNLHNFGGRTNLHGDLKLLAKNQYQLAKKTSKNICGSGLFMESIGQNPVYYDLAFEMPLHKDHVNLSAWINQYATRRYGSISTKAQKAWKILIEGPYGLGTNGVENSSIIAARPALHVKKSGPNAGFKIPYDPKDLIKAEQLLLSDSKSLKKSDPYRFDIVDICRQILSNLGQEIQKKATLSFERKDKKSFKLHSQRFLKLIEDLDLLLRTRSEFNFDVYLQQARSWGNNKKEKNQYEKNATALYTIWGGDGDPNIFDYAWHEWSGLIEGFYLKRWEMFYQMLEKCLLEKKEYNEKGLPQAHGREAFRANKFYEQLANWELAYVKRSKKARHPAQKGDEIKTCKKLFAKYKKLAQEYYH